MFAGFLRPQPRTSRRPGTRSPRQRRVLELHGFCSGLRLRPVPWREGNAVVTTATLNHIIIPFFIKELKSYKVKSVTLIQHVTLDDQAPPPSLAPPSFPQHDAATTVFLLSFLLCGSDPVLNTLKFLVKGCENFIRSTLISLHSSNRTRVLRPEPTTATGAPRSPASVCGTWTAAA